MGNAWKALGWIGNWKLTDWTIKVDPDAVLIPDRMRYGHLKFHTGVPGYIVNCNKGGMSTGPMMFGSIEAISRQAWKGTLLIQGGAISAINSVRTVGLEIASPAWVRRGSRISAWWVMASAQGRTAAMEKRRTIPSKTPVLGQVASHRQQGRATALPPLAAAPNAR